MRELGVATEPYLANFSIACPDPTRSCFGDSAGIAAVDHGARRASASVANQSSGAGAGDWRDRAFAGGVVASDSAQIFGSHSPRVRKYVGVNQPPIIKVPTSLFQVRTRRGPLSYTAPTTWC